MQPRTWTRALVTGASSGIGDAFARRLAAEGSDLVVVARDRKRLEALAKELRAAHDVDVEVLRADLAKRAQRRTVEERLADTEQPVDLLVNNAGFGTQGDFAELDIDEEERQIAVNVLAVTRLAHAAVGAMVPRGRGAVLNVSSVAAHLPSPRGVTYAATKAYVSQFSEGLHQALRDSGVTVTVVEPGLTRTEFHERADIPADEGLPEFVWESADQVAAYSLEATRQGQARRVSGRANKAAVGLARILPGAARRRAMSIMAGRRMTGEQADDL